MEAQGDLGAALAAYRQSLEVRERLARTDPSNADRQRDLGISHDNVGGVMEAQGDLGAALDAYRQALEISERLGRTIRQTPNGSGTSASATKRLAA